jgi:hypothetical protein
MPRTFEQATRHVRQFICGLHGHDALFHFDRRHISLVCVACGYESPGWNLPGSGTVGRVQGDPAYGSHSTTVSSDAAS